MVQKIIVLISALFVNIALFLTNIFAFCSTSADFILLQLSDILIRVRPSSYKQKFDKKGKETIALLYDSFPWFSCQRTRSLAIEANKPFLKENFSSRILHVQSNNRNTRTRCEICSKFTIKMLTNCLRVLDNTCFENPFFLRTQQILAVYILLILVVLLPLIATTSSSEK